MKKMILDLKKALVASLTALALAFVVAGTGAITAAPAQAVNGSTVGYYVSQFPTERLRTQNTGGAWVFQAIGTYVNNVYQTCPPNSSRRLWYRAPSGGTGLLGYGTCLRPSQVGQYEVRIQG